MTFKNMKETPEEFVKILMKNQHIPDSFFEPLVELAKKYIEDCNKLMIECTSYDLYWTLSDAYHDAIEDIKASMKRNIWLASIVREI